MIPDQDFQTLKNQLQVALNRIEELEQWRAFHNGIGGAIASMNSPHAFLSIDTAEYGGGDMRLDSTGIQIRSDATLRSALRFLSNFSSDPTQVLPQTQVQGVVATGFAELYMEAKADTQASRTSIDLASDDRIAGSERTDITLVAQPAGLGSRSVTLLIRSIVGGAKRIGISSGSTAGPAAFNFCADTVDPTYVLVNGDVWYRSNTNKFRGRSGGVTDNFAMEGWVTETAPLGSGSTRTIQAGGDITVSDGYHLIDTNGGAATDDLTTINGSVRGKLYLLRAVAGARDVVVKNGTGNIFLAGSDFTLNNTNDTILLVSDGTNLYEVARANNGA